MKLRPFSMLFVPKRGFNFLQILLLFIAKNKQFLSARFAKAVFHILQAFLRFYDRFFNILFQE